MLSGLTQPKPMDETPSFRLEKEMLTRTAKYSLDGNTFERQS